VVVVVDNQYLDRVGNALDSADKNISKAISNDDYDQLKKAVSDGSDSVDKAIES
jgi:hypothetical protein